MSSPEQQPKGAENIETPKASEEQYDKLLDKIESGAERSVENGEKAAERAKVEALETAISVEKSGTEKAKRASDNPAPKKRRGAIAKLEKEASFKRHMQAVQAEMSAPQRAFSKVIHNKAVEKTSEVLDATVARPNAILSGAVVAFFLVLGVYLVSKHLGYTLSGFETIGAFAVGWFIGVLYDYFRIMITGKK